MAHWLEDSAKWDAPGGSWGMQGLSRGSMRTGFVGSGILKGMLFDGGVNTYVWPKVIMITHTHTDHTAALADICTGGEQAKPFEVLLPMPAVQPVLQFFYAVAALADCQAQVQPGPITSTPERFKAVSIHGMNPGDSAPVPGANIVIKAVGMDHIVPTLGYIVCEVKNLLKPELKGIDKAVLMAKKRAGEVITERTEVPVMMYAGDTKSSRVLQIFSQDAPVAPVVFIECTFLDQVGEINGHCDWKSIEPAIRKHYSLGTTFVLIHFSRRYTDDQVCAHFKPLALELPELVIWLHRGPVTLKDLK